MFNISVGRKGKRTASSVLVTGTPTILSPANNNRKSIMFQNQGGTTCFVGKQTVSDTGPFRGYALFASATLTDSASDDEWWGIATMGDCVVHVIEVV